MVDLTFPFSNEMPRLGNPWIAPYQLEQASTHSENRRSVMNLGLSTHTGTHVDAPFHFDPHGITIDQVPLERLWGPGVLLDLCDQKPGQEITPELLAERQPAPLQDCLAVLNTGWYRRWPSGEFFSRAPYLGIPAAEWLLAQEVRALAVDLPSIDDVNLMRPGQPLPVHVKILGAGVPIIECLNNLHRLPAVGFTLGAFPLPLSGADGSPARVVAWLD